VITTKLNEVQIFAASVYLLWQAALQMLRHNKGSSPPFANPQRVSHPTLVADRLSAGERVPHPLGFSRVRLRFDLSFIST
jgi:hypothetical protein